MVGYSAADWRDPTEYSYLALSAGSRFAWEWLRRCQDYRDAWNSGDHRAATAFGLHRLEDPSKGFSARPIWIADPSGSLMEADAVFAPIPTGVSLIPITSMVSIYKSSRAEHLLISDGYQELRIDILSGSLASGPALLHWRMHGTHDLAPKFQSLTNFSALIETGRFPRNKIEKSATRRALTVRIHDAVASGASQQEIARVLFSRTMPEAHWRICAPEVRSRVQRLVAKVRVEARKSALGHSP